MGWAVEIIPWLWMGRIKVRGNSHVGCQINEENNIVLMTALREIVVFIRSREG